MVLDNVTVPGFGTVCEPRNIVKVQGETLRVFVKVKNIGNTPHTFGLKIEIVEPKRKKIVLESDITPTGSLYAGQEKLMIWDVKIPDDMPSGGYDILVTVFENPDGTGDTWVGKCGGQLLVQVKEVIGAAIVSITVQ